MHPELTVRNAASHDIEQLIAIEAAAWHGSGAPLLAREQFADWLEERSPYFLVAEKEGAACAYYFGRLIAFAPERIEAFLDPALVTGNGWSAHRANPFGNAVYGISVASVARGAGRALMDAVHERLRRDRVRYFLGFTRMTGLDAYLQGLERAGAGRLPAPEASVALWYAHENARLLGLRAWREGAARPALDLAPLRVPDPVIAFHVRGSTAGLMAVLPGYMPDRASRNYGALFVSERPHR
ncbi:MAG TPA: hypothetical protein VHO23_03605 [Candidatus Paceibacterota bacterium]|nr:hypothetical protein [Candidatus Paceibacterota bacterium]